MQSKIKFSLLLIFFINAAMSQVTYNYTGNNYNNFIAPYSASSQITGSFEVASALAASSTTDLTNTLQVFSFSDGQATRNETNTVLCDFSITTNANGNITDWSIYMRQNNTGPTENQHTIDIFPNIEQSGFDANQGNINCDPIAIGPLGSSNVAVSPSAWTGGPVQPARPVPALSLMSLLMLGFLVVLLGFYTQRRAR